LGRFFYVEPGTRLYEVADKVADQIDQMDHHELNYRELQTLNNNLKFLEEKMTKHRTSYFFKFFHALGSYKYFHRFRVAEEIDSNRISDIKNCLRQLLPEKKWVAEIPRLAGLLNDITQIQSENFKTWNRNLTPQLPENHLSNMPITCCAKIFDYIVDPSNQLVEQVLQRLTEAYLQFFSSLQETLNKNRDDAPLNQYFMNSPFAIRLVQGKLQALQISGEEKDHLESSLESGFRRFMNERTISKKNMNVEARANLPSENKRPMLLNNDPKNMMQYPLSGVDSLIKSFLEPTELGRSASLNQAHWKSFTTEAMIASLAQTGKPTDNNRFIGLLNQLKTHNLTVFPQNCIEQGLIQRRNSYLLKKYMKIFLEHLKPQNQNDFFKKLNDDLFLSTILKLPKITVSLNLSLCRQITDVGLVRLSNFPALASLDLSECAQITNVGLVHLCNLPALTSLNLSQCSQITNEGLAHLRNLPALASLQLSSCRQITDVGLAHLNNLPALTSLNLSGCRQITDAGLAHLGNLPALASLNLCLCRQITDEGLTHLNNLPALTSLNLSACRQITDAGLAQLSHLPALALLDLFLCTQITNVGMQRLRSVFPKLKTSS
jgi:hypothetical protein